MNEKMTKTTVGQRIIIGVIAAFMLISTVAVYALIVLNGETSERTKEENEAKLAELEQEVMELETKVTEMQDKMAEKHRKVLDNYRSVVKPYNSKSVDNAGLITKDLVHGTGTQITAGSEYMVYYIGWCSDESVFNSSYDDFENPTSILPLFYRPETEYIAGWSDGLIGMKAGGVREIDIPGAMAYGADGEICDGANSPLKYLVYAIEPDSEYMQTRIQYENKYQEYVSLYYSMNPVSMDEAYDYE